MINKHPSLENNRDAQQWAIEFFQAHDRSDLNSMQEWEYIDLMQEWFAEAIKAGNCACGPMS